MCAFASEPELLNAFAIDIFFVIVDFVSLLSIVIAFVAAHFSHIRMKQRQCIRKERERATQKNYVNLHIFLVQRKRFNEIIHKHR